jgi:CPA1 family monovalent cation:H+ antiporter
VEITSNLNLYLLFAMLILAASVTIVTKWIRLPYSIALVIVGLSIGIFHWLPVVVMTPELILLIFLPTLLFEASWNLPIETLKSSYKPVALLATAGVVLSCVIVGCMLNGLMGLDFRVALLFGAMISATDPISVLALFKRLNVDRRLHTILEGESLLNDGTAVVLFQIFLASLLVGGDLSWAQIAVNFFGITFGGALIGAVIGFLASKITKFFDDHLLETTLTVLVAYGSYILAEHLHVSSVISVLSAGMVMGTLGSRTGMSASTRFAVESFWEYSAFIAESLVFLLIGMQIKFDLLVKYLPFIGAGILAILVARFLVVFCLCPLVSTKSHPIPSTWRHLLFWGGLRGSLCMALALSLPKTFPDREMIVVTTFGVVLFTLLVPGLTMEPLVKLLRLKGERGSKIAQLEQQLKVNTLEKKKLERSVREGKLKKKEFRELNEKLSEQRNELETLIQIACEQPGQDIAIERLQTEGELIMAQKDRLAQLSARGQIRPEIHQEFQTRVTANYLRVHSEARAKTEERL